MALAGPRLDRPSAIGDDGRPRAASLTVAAVIVLALVAATSIFVDTGSIVSTVASGVVLFVTGLALLDRNGLRSLYGGHLCLHAGVGLFVGVLAYALVVGPRVLTLGYVAALLGIGTAWTDTLDEETFRQTLSLGGGSYARMLAVFVVLLVLLVGAVFTGLLLAAFVDVTGTGVSLTGFFALVAGVVTAFALALRALPLGVVLDDGATDRIRRWRVAAVLVAAGAVLYVVLAGVLAGTGRLATVGSSAQPVALLAAVLSSLPVVTVLGLAGAVFVTVALAAWLVPLVADRVDAGDSAALASWTAGATLACFLAGSLLTPLAGPPLLGLFVVLFAVFGLPIALVLVLFVPAFVAGSYMARAATGPALSSAGLVAVGIGAALSGVPAPLTFACIAGAIVVWDVSTFGTALTVELGHIPDTRRLELYHAVISVGVGVGAVVTLSVVDGVRRVVGRPATLAAVLAVVGVVFLLLADRRRRR